VDQLGSKTLGEERRRENTVHACTRGQHHKQLEKHSKQRDASEKGVCRRENRSKEYNENTYVGGYIKKDLWGFLENQKGIK